MLKTNYKRCAQWQDAQGKPSPWKGFSWDLAACGLAMMAYLVIEIWRWM